MATSTTSKSTNAQVGNKAKDADPAPKGKQQVADRNQGQVNALLRAERAKTSDAAVRKDGRDYIDAKLDGVKAVQATALVKVLQLELNKKTGHLNDTAIDQIKADLAANTIGASNQAVADVSANSKALAEKSGAVAATISAKAKDHADAALKTQFAPLQSELDATADTFQPSSLDEMSESKRQLRGALDKQFSDSKFTEKLATARKTAETEAKAAMTKAGDADLEAAVRAEVQKSKGHKAELTKRKDNDADLDAIIDPLADASFTDIKHAIQVYFEDKLGAHGAGFTRSKQLKAFRKGLKDAGSAQARTDIDAELPQDGTANTEYVRMMAKHESYDGSKQVVDSHLTGRAGEETTALVDQDKAHIKQQIVAAASPKAWAAMRDISDAKAAKAAGAKAAASAASAQTKEILTAKKKAAHDRKNVIVGKPTEDKQAGTVVNNPGEVAKESKAVADKVHTKDAQGKNVATKALEAANGPEAMSLLGKIIDMAAPTPGSSCELDVMFKIPVVVVPGLFIDLGMKGSVKRGDEDEGVKAEIAAQVGASGKIVPGFSLAGHLQYFLEAVGKTTKDTVLLLQYSLYRGISTGPSAWAAGTFAGTHLDEKKTGMGQREMNETWAAMVEEKTMTDDKWYTSMGAGVDAKAKLNAGPMEGQVGLEGRLGRRYDKSSLEKTHQLGKLDHSGKTKSENDKKALDTAKAKVDQGSKLGWSASLKSDFDINLGKFAIGCGLEARFDNDGCELEPSFSIPASTETGVANQVIGEFIPKAAGIARSIYEGYMANKAKQQHQGEELSGGQKAGMSVEAIADSAHALDTTIALAKGSMENSLQSKLAGVGHTEDLGKIGDSGDAAPGKTFLSKNSLQVALSAKHSWDKGPKEWDLMLNINQVSKTSIDLDFGGGVSVELEKKKRLLGVDLNKKKFV